MTQGPPRGSIGPPNAYERPAGGRVAQRANLGECSEMTVESNLPDVTLGDDEPPMARVMLVISIVVAIALLILHGVLFPGSEIPALGDVISLFSGLANSGIWIFLIGIMIGFGMMVATVMGEALED